MVLLHLQSVWLINSTVARLPLQSKSNYLAMVHLSPHCFQFYCTYGENGVQLTVLHHITVFELLPSQSI